MSVAQRKFFTEVAALLDKTVIVATTTGKTFSGTLIGINPDSLNLAVAEAKDETGQVAHRVFLNGKVVAQISSTEKPFDLKALANRLEKPVFLEGEPGVGKTEVAIVMSSLFGTDLIRLQCYEGLDAATSPYEWNYPKQLLQIRLEEK